MGRLAGVHRGTLIPVAIIAAFFGFTMVWSILLHFFYVLTDGMVVSRLATSPPPIIEVISIYAVLLTAVYLIITVVRHAGTAKVDARHHAPEPRGDDERFKTSRYQPPATDRAPRVGVTREFNLSPMGLFSPVTGAFRRRAPAVEAPKPDSGSPPASKPAQSEDPLEIPTFLRRQHD
jgi:hypothetical protein